MILSNVHDSIHAPMQLNAGLNTMRDTHCEVCFNLIGFPKLLTVRFIGLNIKSFLL